MSDSLHKIQMELTAPKGQYNDFGKYKYRACEDILEAVKPLLDKHGGNLLLNDEVVLIGDRYYVKATATYTGDEVVTAAAYAREQENKKGMDASQITGAASSYARKYALNALLLIDDNKDADSNEARSQADNAPSVADEIKNIESLEELASWWAVLTPAQQKQRQGQKESKKQELTKNAK